MAVPKRLVAAEERRLGSTKAYRQARRDAYSQAVARFQQGTSAAATILLRTMVDPGTPASVRVRAAEVIFSHAFKAIEIEDIEARVSELEQAAALSANSNEPTKKVGSTRKADSSRTADVDDAGWPDGDHARPWRLSASLVLGRD